MALAGPLQWLSQQLGQTVVQLKGWLDQRHLILVASALGIQPAHEGICVLPAHLFLLIGAIIDVNNLEEEIWALEHFLHGLSQGELELAG